MVRLFTDTKCGPSILAAYQMHGMNPRFFHKIARKITHKLMCLSCGRIWTTMQKTYLKKTRKISIEWRQRLNCAMLCYEAKINMLGKHKVVGLIMQVGPCYEMTGFQVSIRSEGSNHVGGSMLRGLNLVVWLSKANTRIFPQRSLYWASRRLLSSW